ncbi:unnamed protein product [Gongylonema pulchrum]|uniref:DUF4704 domain-containing protein n=1 Tax=Gongylonema pulchrum TaxID=637853 RepID=A0A183E7D4_9BILA|nr:unnamed protein product [Gongylonema pulchrum]
MRFIGVLEHLAEIIQNGPDELIGEIVNIRIAWPAVITMLTSQPDEHFRNHLFSLLMHILMV